MKLNEERINEIAITVGMDNPNFKNEFSLIVEGMAWLVIKAIIMAESFPKERKESLRILSTLSDDLPFMVFESTLERIMNEVDLYLEEKSAGAVVDPQSELSDLFEFYEHGFERGIKIKAWPYLANHYRIARREMTIVTGYPSSGKSEFMDALLVELAMQENWKFAVFSPENFPHVIHYEKLLSKYNKMPFHAPLGYSGQPRMTKDDVARDINWVQDHFSMLKPDEDNINLDAILALAKTAKKTKGIDGLIIDPWNEISHTKPKDESETDYIGRSLMTCRRFARNNDIALWVVAHPYKPTPKDDGSFPIPTPYSISGSAHWANKADNCLAVYRTANDVEVYVQKIKFKMRGKIGMVKFEYDKVNGRYTEINDSVRQTGVNNDA
jgi:twinkle protein